MPTFSELKCYFLVYLGQIKKKNENNILLHYIYYILYIYPYLQLKICNQEEK